MSEYAITEEQARRLVRLSRIEAENAEQLNAQIAANEGLLGAFGLDEIVRCKDCELMEQRTSLYCTYHDETTTRDGFCAWGRWRAE